ncbi:MAG: CTP synthase [Candidatus Magasanikbacteria bacterium CG10_big_fil_rev_8_21_14_0_10_40_10]|uniref:CTP synthase n=1 Tax=Candidatus Magasanikbacteria bacterium CG10_big_fil_rev_8_21_14_0_10_40_10 TaxID=1974648 RepID=A0A2M6W462_9BACT|nr:MAG: CTP synthase [Candidatus Magasanikbacteria bacterium CG10_big_fil_rev_8_21_14_0_10_40_10]
MKTKYIFVIGGVLSGVGKGVTTASIGRMFKNHGYHVSAIKIDPYINVDAGTMNPVEHGEVFVTEDGDETDQDIGNYERFLDTNIYSINYLTTGRVYQSVIEKERSMYYKGKCVEVVPHIPLEVIDRIEKAAQKVRAQIMIIEVGGTVGEYQNILFLEAARMMKLRAPDDVSFVLVSFLPVPAHLGEMKTKPTQHASRTLNASGIQADFIIARGPHSLDKPRRQKLALLCGLRTEDEIISAPDVPSIYEIPAILEKQNLFKLLCQRLKIKSQSVRTRHWDSFVLKMRKATTGRSVKIAVVGKYFGTGDYILSDSYISVIEAVKHASWHNNVTPIMTWIDSEEYEKTPAKVKELSQYDGLIVPGGFGTRGVEGIIMAIKYARENALPYLGLCYGMQLASVEFARHVLGLEKAHTIEFNSKSPDLIIHINPLQAKNVADNHYGGTMRLGAYDCDLVTGAKVHKLYGVEKISERHRHRYEFNNQYRQAMEKAGLRVVGVNKKADLVEIVELVDHPFFVGTQFHPELKSRPLRPHPLFVGLIKAGLNKK